MQLASNTCPQPACSRRALLASAALLAAPPPPASAAAAAAIAPLLTASWSASAGLPSLFAESAYAAMRDDAERTGGFEGAIRRRLAGRPGLAVLDLGTGPYALLALQAARAGARVVYAVEADPAVATLAEAAVAAAGFSSVVTVLRGRSTDVTLPERVDLVLAEIVGSVASEEGALASVRDAQLRHCKAPHDASSWIPAAAQTLCAPAAFALHAYAPRGSPPVRLNCRDETLQLLAEPQVLETIRFSDRDLPLSGRWAPAGAEGLTFRLSGARMEAAARALQAGLLAAGSPAADAAAMASAVAGGLSGLALWPRLELEEGVSIAARGPGGEPKASHWQTVLALLAPQPLPVQAGDELEVHSGVDLRAGEPPYYLLEGVLLDGETGKPLLFRPAA